MGSSSGPGGPGSRQGATAELEEGLRPEACGSGQGEGGGWMTMSVLMFAGRGAGGGGRSGMGGGEPAACACLPGACSGLSRPGLPRTRGCGAGSGVCAACPHSSWGLPCGPPPHAGAGGRHRQEGSSQACPGPLSRQGHCPLPSPQAQPFQGEPSLSTFLRVPDSPS